MKKFLAVVAFVAFLARGAAGAQREAAPPPTLCYGYVYYWNLFVTCKGQTEQVTRSNDVDDFAVASDGSAVALSRRLGMKRRPSKGYNIPEAQTELVSLKPDFQWRWLTLGSGGGSLQSSCGTILAIVQGPHLSEETYDVFTGVRLRYDPYTTFLCSSDRSTIVGHISPDRHSLMTGLPPSRQIAHSKDHIVAPYDISPNGQNVAFLSVEGHSLCVENEGKNLACVNVVWTERISVSDSMGVLFTYETAMYFDRAGHWSKHQLPGYNDFNLCIMLFYWRPGNKEPQELQIYGRNAQWLTPESATALCAWGDRGRSSGRTSPK
jgi:hypothetical protein